MSTPTQPQVRKGVTSIPWPARRDLDEARADHRVEVVREDPEGRQGAHSGERVDVARPGLRRRLLPREGHFRRFSIRRATCIVSTSVAFFSRENVTVTRNLPLRNIPDLLAWSQKARSPTPSIHFTLLR